MKIYKQILDDMKQDFATLSNGTQDFHFASKCSLVQDRIELLQEAIKEVADATKRV